MLASSVFQLVVSLQCTQCHDHGAQDAQQSDVAQQVPPVLAMLPAQQQPPSLPPSAPSSVTAASSSSHVVDATGHQFTADPAAGEGLLPKAFSLTTDQGASGADEPPSVVDAQPQHHTAAPDQAQAPATCTADTTLEREVAAVVPAASQSSTAGTGQSEASASPSASAVDTAAAQQSAPLARLPSTGIEAQQSAELAKTCSDATGTVGEHTASQAAVTDGVATDADQQQSAGAQQQGCCSHSPG